MKNKIMKMAALLMAMCLAVGMMTGCDKGLKKTDGNTKDSSADSSQTTPNSGENMGPNAQYILANLMDASFFEGELYVLTSEMPACDVSMEFYVNIDMSIVKDYAMIFPIDSSADVYVVIRTTDTEAAVKALEEYRDNKMGDFAGYAPKEEKKLKDADIIVKDDTVALLVGEDSKILEQAFNACFESDFELSANGVDMLNLIPGAANASVYVGGYNPEDDDHTYYNFDGKSGRAEMADGAVFIEEVQGVIDVYDTTPIVEAYKSGDDSKLNDRDKEVLAKAKEILDDINKNYKTQYDKEKAVHDYIQSHTEYDENCLIYSNWFTEFADQPYGCLIMGQAICIGYTTTFKMFMDMLDIECIVVTGAANESKDNHAWNMVKLDDGKWYIVDVTWDDPVGGMGMYYDFFNTTDEFITKRSHHWDQEKYPAAVGGKYAGLEETEASW